jgi:hypothetical protein
MEFQKKGWARVVGWLALGTLLGAGLGLLLGWVVWPTEFTEADPTVLEEKYQLDYTLMIASTYWMEEDIGSARRRLESLGHEDYIGWFRRVTIDHILNGAEESQIRQLVNLAADLGIYSPAMEPYWPGGFEVESP